MDEAEARHPIAVVMRRTRLSAELLRAWERRYGAVRPGRGATGRRLYSDLDIERLRLLKQLTEGGRRIGEVAALPLAALQGLEREDIAARLESAALAPARPAGPGRPAPGEECAALLARALAAVEDLDPRALQAVLGEASVALSPARLREEFLVPLMVLIGQRWHEGSLRVAHEHLATAVVQGFVTELQRRPPLSETAPRLVAATLTGSRHELGVLLACAAAAEEGWDVAYLGPGLPAEEIAAAARQRRAQAVALGLTLIDDRAFVQRELGRLRELIGPGVQLYIGGAAASRLGDALGPSGAVAVPTLAEFSRLLRLKSN
ncbi:MerR family transcriptional regulator [bacterium]|nr:MerR family transcriptional regulator [bacterium]